MAKVLDPEHLLGEPDGAVGRVQRGRLLRDPQALSVERERLLEDPEVESVFVEDLFGRPQLDR